MLHGCWQSEGIVRTIWMAGDSARCVSIFTMLKEKHLEKLPKCIWYSEQEINCTPIMWVWKSSVFVTSKRRFGNRSAGRNTIWDVLRRMVRISHTGYSLDGHKSRVEKSICRAISIKW